MQLFHLTSPKPSKGPHLFEGLDWSVNHGECWAIFGSSGSGKSLLKDILAEHLHPNYAELSPQLEDKLLAREDHEDDSEFTEGGFDPGRTAREMIFEPSDEHASFLEEKIKTLNLSHVLDTPYRNLSNGETRKVLLLRALAHSTQNLILDSPFEGLDQASQALLKQTLDQTDKGKTLFLFTSHLEEIPSIVQGVVYLKKNRPPLILSLSELQAKVQTSSTTQKLSLPEELSYPSKACDANPLIDIKRLNIRYGDKVIFKDFQWQLKKGEAWLISGPNGTGKTTLLQIIHADHSQSYGQDLVLFGYQRGKGESIWDIKSHIGFVSVDFQRHFPKSMTGLAMVVSGFHDSMGVYKKPSSLELHLAGLWLKTLGLEELGNSYLSKLSWGEIRMLMIARALVKKPHLLILDEPCQGLDPRQAQLVLELIDLCFKLLKPTLLFVTHHQKERPSCIHKHLIFTPPNHPQDATTYNIQDL